MIKGLIVSAANLAAAPPRLPFWHDKKYKKPS